VKKVAETARLLLRWLDEGDAAFIVDLVNQPSWIRYIGDKGIRTVHDAQRYLREGPLAMYERHGFGLYAVETRDSRVPIGICGLIKRDSLEDVDLGFALLPAFWGQGYAVECASAAVAYGRNVLGISRVVAVLSPGNLRSQRVLEKLDFRFERMIRLQTDGEALELHASAG
jgi:RimJ/RimL family protein N-acetyltransferase